MDKIIREEKFRLGKDLHIERTVSRQYMRFVNDIIINTTLDWRSNYDGKLLPDWEKLDKNNEMENMLVLYGPDNEKTTIWFFYTNSGDLWSLEIWYRGENTIVTYLLPREERMY